MPLSGQMPSVHPHVCGERARPAAFTLGFLGSSPRVWGAPEGIVLQAPLGRFIPTCVGSAGHKVTPASIAAVHPHVCGERAVAIRSNASPIRFIPTCVGSAPSYDFWQRWDPVHPHVCGERETATVSSSA